jgi:hypothetical protein
MFSTFFFKPTPTDMLNRIMKRVIHERYELIASDDKQTIILQELSEHYLEEIFDDFFNPIHN